MSHHHRTAQARMRVPRVNPMRTCWSVFMGATVPTCRPVRPSHHTTGRASRAGRCGGAWATRGTGTQGSACPCRGRAGAGSWVSPVVEQVSPVSVERVGEAEEPGEREGLVPVLDVGDGGAVEADELAELLLAHAASLAGLADAAANLAVDEGLVGLDARPPGHLVAALAPRILRAMIQSSVWGVPGQPHEVHRSSWSCLARAARSSCGVQRSLPGTGRGRVMAARPGLGRTIPLSLASDLAACGGRVGGEA